jgi:hypothetical protein
MGEGLALAARSFFSDGFKTIFVPSSSKAALRAPARRAD